LAARTGQPTVIYRREQAERAVWRDLDAATCLTEEGEVVLPLKACDPDEVERRLRVEAGRRHGRARLKLLEAAFAMRCRRRIAASR
jgi:hypothetical protein